jgi:hypothetical protein
VSAARVSIVAAITAVAAWGMKGVAIALAGGLDKSALESPLFIVGLVAIIVAAGAFGAALATRRPAWLRALAVIVAVALAAVVALGVQTLIKALLPDSAGWVEEEAGLWVSASLTAAVIVVWLQGREDARSSALP